MSNEQAPPNSDSLTKARELLEAQDFGSSLLALKEEWLKDIDNLQCIRFACELMRAAGRQELSEHLSTLAASVEKGEEDPQSLFEVGFRFIDDRQNDLAAELLTKCAQLADEESVVHYELGFALMSMRRYGVAIPHFEKARSIQKDFDTVLNLLVCYVCSENYKKASEMLELATELAEDEEQTKEVSRQKIVLQRLEECKDKIELTLRDWLYILYGTLLLDQNAEKGSKGKYGQILEDYTRVAAILVVLRGVLEGIGCSIDTVEYYSQLSRPIAEAFAEMIGARCENYKGPTEENTLLMMAWAGDIIGPHESFIPKNKQRLLFCYSIGHDEALPLIPELVGCVSEGCAMPWAEQWQVEEREGLPPSVVHLDSKADKPLEIAERIVEKASGLEADSDLLKAIQVAVSYYEPKRKRLVLSNGPVFTERPEYTAEVPL
jgi:tetratricopeptide (TPR) repeat protein